MALFASVKKTYYQVIYCRRSPGKVWRREITVSNGAAIAVRAELLMPEDVEALFKAGWSDKVYVHKGPMAVRGTITNCIFCENTAVFMCYRCGKMFCCRSSWYLSVCPLCNGSQEEHNYVREGFMPMSGTGFLNSWKRFRLRPDGSPFSRGVMDWALPDKIAVVDVTMIRGTVVERPSLPEPAKELPPPRPLELPAPEKEDARARLRKYLKEKQGE